MGKPKISRMSSNQSLMHSQASKTKVSATVSSHKSLHRKKSRHHRTKQNIKKVFNGLRNETNTSIDTLDTTIIVVDNTPSDSSKYSSTPIRDKKRKLQVEDCTPVLKKYRADSVIIIDDESTTPKQPPPVTSSTPYFAKEFAQDVTVTQNNNTTLVQNFNDDVKNLTKEVNRDSYITIDLTAESLNCSNNINNKTVEDSADCTVVSVSNASLSLSGESEVTVLNITPSKRAARQQMKSIFNGISKMGSSERNVMLKYVVKSIFNGCTLPDELKDHLEVGAAAPVEDSIENQYIKQNIVGVPSLSNSIGSNIYNPEADPKNKSGLRMVVIDGSNVAMEHGKGREFSVRALKICIDYFLKRGHVVKAFVPRFRCKYGKSTDPRMLDDLERRGLVVYTPSREIQGRLITSYDDRYIVQCAAEFDGVIVSGDNYRDLLRENPRWRQVIENRVLPFTWVNDMIMFPRDPLGRHGPTLEQFLKHDKSKPSVFKL